MATTVRSKLSEKNKYWINRHRYYELKHFCLQYPLWKKVYLALSDDNIKSPKFDSVPGSNTTVDFTADYALARAYYSEKMTMVENAAIDTDDQLWNYILKGVTEGMSYTYLRLKFDMPCSKDMYYDRYRKFFWLLSKSRN